MCVDDRGGCVAFVTVCLVARLEAVSVVGLCPHRSRRQLVGSHVAQVAVGLARRQVRVADAHLGELLPILQ